VASTLGGIDEAPLPEDTMTTTLTPAATDSPTRAAARAVTSLYGGRTWLRTVHLLADLPIGVAAFTLASTAVSLSAGLAITLVGLPLLVLTLVGARQYARFERARVRVLLGVPVEAPAPRGGGLAPRQWVAELRTPAGWKALAHALIALPVGVVTFTAVVTGWVTAFALVVTPIAAPWLPGESRIGSLHLDSPAGAVAAFAAGVVLAVLMPLVVRGLAAMDAAIARLLLS
jgi:hypothetical protein